MIHVPDLSITTKMPHQCTGQELAEFKAMVEEGGAVAAQGLRQRMMRAVALVFARSGGQLVGVAALKRPTVEYREKVFNNGCAPWLKEPVDLLVQRYAHEVGWVYVAPEARGGGLARKLVLATLNARSFIKGATFATCAAAEVRIRRVLESTGFVDCQQPFPSERSGQKLLLYLRPASALGVSSEEI